MSHKFVVNEVVRVSRYAPLMSVVRVASDLSGDGDIVTCGWVKGTSLQRHEFRDDELEFVGPKISFLNTVKSELLS